MYTTYFKMTDTPFMEKVPVRGIMRDERLNQGLARLRFMTKHTSLALITGDAGIGKTSLLRLFMNDLGKNRFRIVYLHITHLRAISLLKSLVSILGERPAHGKERVMAQIQTKIQKTEIPTILLIDEAHLLDPDALVDLRLILSSAVDEMDRLQIVLAGHSDIRKELRRSCHESLNQRITVRYHISAMTITQTHRYIDYHMQRVNSSGKLFDDQVKNDIYDMSKGIPRLINNYAALCLLNAAIDNKRRIDTDVLAKTVNEFHMMG